MRKRKRRDVEGAGRDGVDRTGRTYAEFEALSLADRSRVVQCDSVEGYERNTYDILSAHIVPGRSKSICASVMPAPAAIVACLDHIESLIGSVAAFEAIFGILLVD